MRKFWKQLPLLLLLMAVMVYCKDEKMEYVDPMIYGLAERAENELISYSKVDQFTTALFGLREQRIKLADLKRFIEEDGYSGDNYGLENKQQLIQHVTQLFSVATFKLDSVWNVSIKNDFDAVKTNSAGIQNFGLNAYELTSTTISNAQTWLMVESYDETDDEWMAFDFLNLQASVGVLLGLSNLNEQEVLEFVTNVNARFASMQQQYADLAGEVATSPHFSKAQKVMYENLEGLLADMAVTIEQDLSLDTVDELDAIDRDLGALVYFVENNYTSPAQPPLVYGEIARITELRWLSEHGSADDYSRNWKLVADIDAAETRRWNDGVGYIPIKEFTGTFDGQYYMISGLYMNDFPDYQTGLVGRLTSGGEIKNLGLVNVDIIVRTGQGGSFVGWAINGKLSNCFSTGHVVVKGQCSAFIGRGDNTQLTNCFTLAAVTYGGIGGNLATFAGYISGATALKNCYATGLVTGTATNSNGFIGQISGAAPTVDGVYWSSELSGKPNASNQSAYNDLLINLPANSWGDLGNFPTFSPDEWEIMTIPELDPNPRPYLKGFNYAAIKDLIK